MTVPAAAPASPAAPNGAPAFGGMPRAGGPEERLIQVAMARFVGCGYLAFLLIAIPRFGQPTGMVAGWYAPVAAVLAYGPGIALVPATYWAPTRRLIRPLAVACFVGFLAACALWFVAWTGLRVPAGEVTWLFCGLTGLAVALVGLRPGIVALLVCAAGWALLTAAGRSGDRLGVLVYEWLFVVVFSLPFVVLIWKVIRTGALLDKAHADSVAAARLSAASTARAAERARFGALIHDNVLATLLAAKADPGDGRLAVQAQIALDEFDALAHPPSTGDEELTAAESLGRLRAVVSLVDPGVRIEVVDEVSAGSGRGRYPAHAVRGLAEAAGEALRNALRHAGGDAERAVVIRLGDDSVQVVIADDGVGFDPASIPAERLGIEVSIRQRMDGLADGEGSAHIESTPGSGTEVRLAWER
ncbi:ATP-binding protein [Gordonia iterans]